MKDGFYSRKSVLGVPNALVLLMLIFFFVPFAGRGARMALQKTENNVKDWLPKDFRETEELAWFAKKFVSEQFVAATWSGCTEDSQRLRMFVSKLEKEQVPASDSDRSSDDFRARQLGAEYALFVGDNYFYNWGGKNEKWLSDENGHYYYITPNGRLYRWDGGANIIGAATRSIARSIGSFNLEGHFVAAFGDAGTEEQPNKFWQDPRLLTAPLFKKIETGPDLVAQLASNGGPLSTPTEPEAGQRLAIGRLTGTMFGPPVPSGFGWTGADVRALLSPEKLQELPADWEATWEMVMSEALTRDYEGSLEKFQGSDPVKQSIVWYEFFDRVAVDSPTRQTCVVITLTEVAKRNLAHVIGRGVLGQPTGRIFEIASECGVAIPPKPTMAPPPFSWFVAKPSFTEPMIHIGGPPVDNVAIDEEGTITLVRLIGYSLALGMGLSFLCLRSTRLMMMVFFVGGVSALASLGLVWWCNASIDAILLTMPSLVYVLGMSGAVHIVNYYNDAVDEKGVAGAAERAIAHAAMPCTLAALTTAIGLLSLCSSNILPIRKFGIFSAMGVMATLVLLFAYLPSALTIFPPKRKVSKVSDSSEPTLIQAFWAAFGAFILKHHWWVNAACFGTLIALGFGLFKIKTSVQLLKLFDSESQIIRDYAWLEDNFGRLVPMELVVRFPESLQRPIESDGTLTLDQHRNTRLQLNILERADAVARIQTVLQDQFGYEGIDIIGQGMSPITFLKDMPEPWRGFNPQRSAYNRILEQSRGDLLKSDYMALETSQAGKNTELWRISLRLGALNDVDYGRFVASLRSAVEPVVAAYRCRQLIMEKILEQNPGISDGIHGKVLILGYNAPKVAKESSDAFVAAEASADRNSPVAIDDTQVLAETLSNCLVNETVRQTAWHDPVNFPLNAEKRTSDQWASYLKNFQCIVLLNRHPDYDINFIQKANPNLIDAGQMLTDIRATASAPRFSSEKPVEESTHPGEMDIVYTGIVPVVYKAQRTLLESLIESVAWSFVLIALIMSCLLSPARNFVSAFAPQNIMQALGCGLISMIPNVFPIVIIFGVMGHANLLVDIGSMMTASVAMGIAVDDTIHFLTWFRSGLRKGLDRRVAIFVAYKSVAPAMTQTTIIGGLGLSVFALSTFTPTQRFGTLMLALLAAALVGDLVFLPALLASPLGRIFTFKNFMRDNSSDVHLTNAIPSDILNQQFASDEYRLADDTAGLSDTNLQIHPPNQNGIQSPQMLRRDRSGVRKR